MTEQQRKVFEAWYNDEYVRPIIPADRTEGGYQHPDAQAAWDAWQAALSHAEGEAQCEAHEPISTPHCPVCLLDERDELRGEVKRLLAEAEDRDNAAPQVAVPEPVGWVKWFDGEPSFQPRDALMPEDAKQHGWQLVGLMRSMPAPAPDERDIAALLERIVPRIDPNNPKPLDETEHCCECTLYYERERIHGEIARLRAGKEGE